jgi:hypothetical protein
VTVKNVKNWRTSKTLWFNFLSIVAVLAEYAAGVGWITIGKEASVIAVVNIGLRLLTDKGIAMGASTPKPEDK